MNKLLDKYKSLPLPVKAGLWFTICNFIQKGISFITVPIFTRVMTTEQFGTVSVYNSWMSLLTVFLTLNLFYGVFNNGMTKYEDAREEYTSSMQGLVTVISLLCFGIYFSFQGFFNNLFELSTALICVMFVEILIHSSLSFWAARQRFEFRYKLLVVITLSVAVLGSITSLIAVFLTESKAEARIISHAGIVVLICGGLYVYNLVKGKRFYHWKFWKFALLFNIPLIPHYLSIMVLSQSDRIIISKLVGTDDYKYPSDIY